MIVRNGQRIVIGMYDGLGPDYVEAAPMPVFRRMMREGFSRVVDAVMPTVTNANNVSIACGAWPAEHGITGNSHLDERTGQPEYMEDGDSILLPTLMQRGKDRGIRSALLTCKKKTIRLLARDVDLAVAAEEPPPEFVARYGRPADIYSSEINFWLWEVALDLLRTRPEIGILYVHTTDYPMHMWPPAHESSHAHLRRLDELLGECAAAAPDAAFLLTADHGMNFKRRVVDPAKACAEQGLPLRLALSAERDRYVKHHRTFGGTAWVWLRSPAERDAAIEMLLSLPGVEQVLTRDEAARRFRTMPERIGELVVLGDRDTVFGEASAPIEELEPTYRSHGSLHEQPVPLVIYGAGGPLPPADEFRANLDLTRFVMR